MSKKQPVFRLCPNCGQENLTEVKDRIHHDYELVCIDRKEGEDLIRGCGYSREMMPRSVTRGGGRFNQPVSEKYRDLMKGGFFKFGATIEELEEASNATEERNKQTDSSE